MKFLKWEEGLVDKSYFSHSGKDIINDEFYVDSAGLHTIYYENKKGQKRAYPMVVKTSDLNIPTNNWGFKINQANTDPAAAITYTLDNATFSPAVYNTTTATMTSNPWKDKFPFNQIKPCVCKNGKVLYYLNPNNYKEKLDGTPSKITGTNSADGDVMIEFPKIYWKTVVSGDTIDVSISNKQVDSGYKPYAHRRGNQEFDYLYVSAYKGYTAANTIVSISGENISKIPYNGLTSSLNSRPTYKQMTNYTIELIQILFLLMYKTRDSQQAQGVGLVVSGSAMETSGLGDSRGLFYGSTSNTAIMKFLGIENIWGGLNYTIHGAIAATGGNVKYNSENDGTDYPSPSWTATSITYTAQSAGYVMKMLGTAGLFGMGSAFVGSGTTGWTDSQGFGGYLSDSAVAIGGGGFAGTLTGLFYRTSLTKTDSMTSFLTYLSN